jgi:hypothetical protein
MARKTKRTYQKQKQQQVQKVVVNVGEKVRAKRKRRARRPPVASQEAREYAQAISEIIPKIQYNFPQHSSFNYDAYQTPNLAPQTKPNNTANSIPLMADLPLNLRENIAQQKDRGFPKSQFTEPNPQPNELKIEKPQPSSTMGRSIPIDHKDKYVSLSEGFNDFARNEQKSFVEETREASVNKQKAETHIKDEKKKLAIEARKRKTYKPKESVITDRLESKGLPNTPENRQKEIDEYYKMREEFTASELRRTAKKDIAEQNKKLVQKGMASVPKMKPKTAAVLLEEEETPSIPLMANKKIVTLADLQNRAANISKMEKELATRPLVKYE